MDLIDKTPEGKLGVFWILGAIALTFGAFLLSDASTSLSQTLVAFILILFAGICWIGVSVGVVHRGK